MHSQLLDQRCGSSRIGAHSSTTGLADQLYRALGSISANLAEGHSRGTGNDRARFYEYGLGSTRESRDWYYKARYILGDAIVEKRLLLLTEVTRLLLTMIPQQRARILREEDSLYPAKSDDGEANGQMRSTDIADEIAADHPAPDSPQSTK